MLVLSRKFRESIIIQTSDGPVEVKILGINGACCGGAKTVRIGIEANKDMIVLRKELLDDDRD